ncbi:MAG: hypothetical protein ACRCYU_12835, partial [Nocardioides sp.]
YQPDDGRNAQAGSGKQHNGASFHCENRLAINRTKERRSKSRTRGERGTLPSARHPQSDLLTDDDGNGEHEQSAPVTGYNFRN